ncbi:MAG: hypothetical protein IT309_08160 [Anaerolineales bacterium]|nr:hypothetical protein [Anaerolineales bacterium]
MASNSSKKSKPVLEKENHSGADQTTENRLADSNDSPFTAEQRQILGNVYQLILGWRRERLMKAAVPMVMTPSNSLPVEREA